MAKKKASRAVGKLGIYVPESRQKQVAEWRDRLNFSEIFWKAFDEAVKFQQCIKVDDQALKSLAKRLVEESNLGWTIGYEQGLSKGRDWFSESASVDDFARVRDFDSKTNEEKEEVATYFYGKIVEQEGYPFIPDSSPQKDSEADEHSDFHFGWSLGFAVGGFEVCKQLAEVVDLSRLDSLEDRVPFADSRSGFRVLSALCEADEASGSEK